MHRIKQVWPKWEGLEILGEGGFGTVYKAKKDSFAGEEFSAIKIIKIPHNPSEHNEMISSGFTNDNIKEYYHKSVLNLVDEIKLMQKMKAASHVVTIEDYEVIENNDGVGYTIFIRMELLTNITKYFREKEITVDDVIKMASHILTALEFCHDQNIMHRDIKPANIFISEFGEYKLGDFGVSREVERTNATMSQKGTKSYMAPEMVRMEKYGKNVDLYALGLTMYELLNHGRMPFLPPFPQMFVPMDREEAVIKRLSGVEFPDIEGVGELNTIIKKACHPDKLQRYQNAKEMKQDLLKLNQKDNIVEENKVEFTEEKTTGLFDNDIFSENETKMDITDDKTLNVFNEKTFLFDDKIIDFDNQDNELIDEGNDVHLIDDKPLTPYKAKLHMCPTCGKPMSERLPGVYVCLNSGSYANPNNKCSDFFKAKPMDSHPNSKLFYKLDNEISKESDIDNKKRLLNKIYQMDPHHYLVCKYITPHYWQIVKKTNKESDCLIGLSFLTKLCEHDMGQNNGGAIYINTKFIPEANMLWSHKTQNVIQTYKKINELLSSSWQHPITNEIMNLWMSIPKNTNNENTNKVNHNDPNKCPVCGNEMEVIFTGIKECTRCDYIVLESNDPKVKVLFDDYKDAIKFSKDEANSKFALSWVRRMYVNCSRNDLIKAINKHDLATKTIYDVVKVLKAEKSKMVGSFIPLTFYDNKDDISKYALTAALFNMSFRKDRIVMEFRPKDKDSLVVFGKKGIYWKHDNRIIDVRYFELYDFDLQSGLLGTSLVNKKQKYPLKLTPIEASVLKSVINILKSEFQYK